MKLRFIEISNFLSYAPGYDQRVDFDGSLTLLIGPNGGGKTNILRAIELVRDVVDREASGSNTNYHLLTELTETKGQPHAANKTIPSELRVGIEFTTDREKRLVFLFWLGCVESNAKANPNELPLKSLPSTEALQPLLDSLCKGEIVLTHQRGISDKWELRYDFNIHFDTESEQDQSTAFAWSLHSRSNLYSDGDLMHTSDYKSVILDSLSSRPLIPQVDELPSMDNSQWSLEELLPSEGERVNLTLESRSIPQGDLKDSLTREGILNVLNTGISFNFDRVLDLIFKPALFSDLSDDSIGTPVFISPNALGANPGEVCHLTAARIPPYLELLTRWKNGSNEDRAKFKKTQDIFTDLRNCRESFDLTQKVSRQNANDDAFLEIAPVIVRENFETTASNAGSGTAEIIRLSTMLAAGDESVILLDEPMARLHPGAQRTFAKYLVDTPGQYIVTSHAAGLIPLDRINSGNIRKIIHRIEMPKTGRSSIYDLRMVRDNSFSNDIIKYLRTIPTSQEIPFASSVIFVSGATEHTVLPLWLDNYLQSLDRKATVNEFPMFFDYSGDGSLHKPIQIAISFGVPWAAIVDGKSFKPEKTNWDQTKWTAEIVNKLWLAAKGIDNQRLLNRIESLPSPPHKPTLRLDENLLDELEKFHIFTVANCYQPRSRNLRSSAGSTCPVCAGSFETGGNPHIESFEDFANEALPKEWDQIPRKIRKNNKLLAAQMLFDLHQECPDPLRKVFKSIAQSTST